MAILSIRGFDMAGETMQKAEVRQQAMERLLRQHWHDTAGLILRLVWREGLTRVEIAALTWERVDFDALLLRLPDREVPLEEEVAEFLRQWERDCGRYGPWVAVSSRRGQRISPASMSVITRRALDSAGQEGVRLQDLRHDFVRRQFQEHGWARALRVSGLSVTTYRNELAKTLGPGTEAAPEPPREDDVGESYKFWKILQTERGTPEGIALWLTYHLGLRLDEIAALTWEQVDFGANLLRLPDREAPLTVGTRRVLEEELARRGPGDDPHVLLSPRSRAPLPAERLSTLLRGTLLRGGIEDRTAADFRRDPFAEERKRLLACASERGSISRSEAAELLGLSPSQTYARLRELDDEGALVLLKGRYYPAGSVVPPKERREAVLRYVGEHSPATRQEVGELLRVGNRTTARLLNDMVEAGDLELQLPGRRYAIPAGEGK